MSDAQFDDQKEIYVTKSFLPPISEFTEILNESLGKNSMTNGGALQYRLILQLKKETIGASHDFGGQSVF